MKSGILVIDKPAGMTSHDAVALVRRLAGTKKVGHGGTLDPLATGVLPIFIGNATRVIEYLHEKDDPRAKKYRAEMRLGIVTDTQDITGETLAEMPPEFSFPSLPVIESVLKSFEGEGEQTPPAYSAIKYQGKKLYDYARSGADIPDEALRKRRIVVDSIEMIDCQPESLTACFEITCSGGLYVRTICHDAGKLLGCGAAMSALRRLKSGPFVIAESVTPDELKRIAEDGGPDALPMLPADSALRGMPKMALTREDTERFLSGIRLSGIAAAEDEGAEADGTKRTVAVYDGDTDSENFIGIAICKSGVLKPRKVLRQITQ
ncbi:MAG: tRNA pseudouridine(55) synthase TruB [Clostridiales Family XIII bacterium]|jgi:tRNA pseudouridine55 synthase|nr:tRNA pseudouridine(55) synthase TruB [Clostridiales Family XIII bacterium]